MDISRKTIMEAWTFLRTNNSTIPSETLDFMKDVSLKELGKVGVSSDSSQLLASGVSQATKSKTGVELDDILCCFEKTEKDLKELINKEHIPANIPDVLGGALGTMQHGMRRLKRVVESF